MRQMLEAQVDEFYYVTVMNENYSQPSMADGIAEQIIKGMYQFASHGGPDASTRVRLLGSGAILREVIAAADLLHRDFDIASDIFSVTSFSEVAREANAIERYNRLHPGHQPRMSHLETCLAGDAPIIAATDYVRAYPQLIASHVRGPYLALGTDGFGRSDTRPALREFFEVDRRHIAVAAISELTRQGRLDRSILQSAITRYALDVERNAPWTV
jgi:pyruvate dehydrogenase E1 component